MRSFDDLDLALLQVLQADGRAPFSRIAEVLGVSDQTVARRYTRLRSDGAVRVLGLTRPQAVGEEQWLVRVRCAPDASTSIARALVARNDTSWVHLVSGGAEILCMVRTSVNGDGESVLLDRLPRTPRVIGVGAHCVLHVFFGGERSALTKNGPLTTEQVDRLRAPVTAPPEEPVPLSEEDRRLLSALEGDGRTGNRELAARTGWSETTVRRRLAELRESGTLYFDLDFDARRVGFGTSATLWLSVAPSEVVAVGEALARHPEVTFAAATTGPANLYANVLCRNSRALYAYLTGPVAALAAVRQVETAPIMRTLKCAGLPIG
nr:Lrp/AsnC family transcriptional regulator [Amycolatopsis anabasis]